MNFTVILPLLATLVSLAFSLMVFDQFLSRHKTYQIVWTIGLLLFALAAFAQYMGTAFGWQANPNYYRLWYVCGAIGTSAFLGMGTIFLIAPRRVAVVTLSVLVATFVIAAFLVFSAPVEVTALPTHSSEEVTGKGFPTYVRLTTPFFNIFGAGFLGLGALHSAWGFWRKRVKLYRVLSNCFIFGGAMAASTAGTITRFGLANGADAFSLATLLGVILIFIGFLISIEVFNQFRVPFTRIVIRERRLQPEALALANLASVGQEPARQTV